MRKLLFFGTLLWLLLTLTLGIAALDVDVVDELDVIADDDSFGDTLTAGDVGDTRFYLYTQQNLSGEPPSDSAIRRLFDIEGDDSAVVLAIYTKGRSADYGYTMYTFGDAYDIFSDRDVDRILDDNDVYSAIKGGRQIEAGATRFFALSGAHVAAFYAMEAADGAARAARAVPMAILVGAIAAVLAGGGASLGVFLYYRRRRRGESYPLDRYARLNLTVSQDRFVGSFVTRARVKSSSSGGGGGGGRGGARGSR